MVFVQNRPGNINPSFLGMLGNRNLLEKGSMFFRFNPFDTSLARFWISINGGEKEDIIASHCLLLARYYVYCCKFKNISPSIREYARQSKYNLEIEKQIYIVTDCQNKFQQKWHKILHVL